MKYAVYVEGKAEMYFVADILTKYSNYDPAVIGFKCINLYSDTYEYVRYPIQGDESSRNYYQIVNVNNDKRLISKLKKDIPNLNKQGYEIIIGLRDVYSEDYKVLCNEHRVDMGVIAKMHDIQYEQIRFKGIDVRLHYAIMEYEAWMMALIDKFLTIKGGNPPKIFETANVDYNSDYEQTVFHPYTKVQQIYEAVNSSYDKHEEDQLSFLSYLTIDDYQCLRTSGRCSSFCSFLDGLLPLGC